MYRYAGSNSILLRFLLASPSSSTKYWKDYSGLLVLRQISSPTLPSSLLTACTFSLMTLGFSWKASPLSPFSDAIL